MLVTSLISIACMQQRIPSSKPRELFSLAALQDKPYLLFNFGMFFGFMGIYVFFFYVQLYASEVCNTDVNLTFYLLSIINAASLFGRLLPNFIADKTGPLNVQVPFAFVTTLLVFAWISVRSTAEIVILCILFGFFTGTFVSLSGPTVVSLSLFDLSTLGTRLGMTFAFTGFGLLAGSPVAGAILRGGQNWTGLQVWCGAALTVSACCLLSSRFVKVGPGWRAKV